MAIVLQLTYEPLARLLRKMKSNEEVAAYLKLMMQAVTNTPATGTFTLIDKRKRKHIIQGAAILKVEAKGDNCRVYYLLNNVLTSYISAFSISSLVPLMMECGLVQCHRSGLVNPLEIVRLAGKGGGSTLLNHQCRVNVSRDRQAGVQLLVEAIRSAR